MSGEHLYDAWKEAPYCLKCERPLISTIFTKCEKCRNHMTPNQQNKCCEKCERAGYSCTYKMFGELEPGERRNICPCHQQNKRDINKKL